MKFKISGIPYTPFKNYENETNVITIYAFGTQNNFKKRF